MTEKIEEKIEHVNSHQKKYLAIGLLFCAISLGLIFFGISKNNIVLAMHGFIVEIPSLILLFSIPGIFFQQDSFTYKERRHFLSSIKCVYFDELDKTILVGLKGDEYQKGVFLEVVKVFSVKEGEKIYEIFRTYAPEDPSLLKLYQKIKNNCYK